MTAERTGENARAWCAAYVARLLGQPAETIDLSLSFFEHGLDSVDAVVMSSEFEAHFGLEVEPGVFLQQHSLNALVDALQDEPRLEDDRMSVLCAITTCMGRLGHLRETLPTAVGQPNMAQILVDYSCPERCGDWAEREFLGKVTVVRVPGKTRFNAADSRNAGARAAQTPWLMFRDADISLAPTFAEEVVPLLQEGRFYVPKRNLQGPWAGVVVMARKDYEALGGYDEVMQGWGYEDKDMYTRLTLSGCKAALFPERLIGWIDHDNASRVQHYDIKHRDISRFINTLYSYAKNDFWKAPGRASEAFRRSLYAQISELIPRLLRTMEPKTVLIKPPAGSDGVRAAGLTYVVDPGRGGIFRKHSGAAGQHAAQPGGVRSKGGT